MEESDSSQPKQDISPSESSSTDPDNEEFEIEKILSKRKINNKIEYKVKWKFYPLNEASWEPIENLFKAKKAIQKYEKERLKKKRKRTKKKQTVNKENKTVKKKVNMQIKNHKIKKCEKNIGLTEELNKGKERNEINIIEINDIFKSEDNLFVKVLCKETINNENTSEKIKFVSLKECGKIAPNLLIKFYERQIRFVSE